ncbi:MAG: hypothetical protein IJG84_16950 [Kiritimatiellae bacterium]|nr:hypothetical protein [Kiritimatiellia bacterium]
MIIAALSAMLCTAVPPPPIEEWEFRRELAEPEALAFVPTNDVRFVRGKVAGAESYRIDVAADGVTVTTEDDEGLRRAVYYYQDRVRAGDLKSCVRRPWVRNRISRCFFGPIKRPPLNHDELMDDVDYYPDAYLDRLAHEGVNGLWLTIEWRDIVETSFAKPRVGAERRLKKLRQTVAKCARYGIKTWAFCIEPKAVPADDPLQAAHPELFGPHGDWTGGMIMCAGSPETRRYIEESTKDLFSKVPGLGGLMMISHGERNTSCFSSVSPVSGKRSWSCPRCDSMSPWQLYDLVAGPVVRGMRAAGSEAEFISWLYQPQPRPERSPWIAELARHPVPAGTVLAYNFESGAIREQLGRFRNGGDYWLSYVGPSEAFRTFAAACLAGGNALGAKIQVGNSHECATVPFVPVPGLLYRKYRAMKAAGVSTVLQCWYFGNYPGVMNKAAGELAYEEFADDEDAFLLRLAAPDWGKDAGLVASLWKRLSDAYAEYPLSNNMQYYGPFHAGIVWPLLPDVEMKPLGRTWKPLDDPSGDMLGECLENHTLSEARMLAGRMVRGSRFLDRDGRDELEALAGRWRGNRERIRDIGVMQALQILFESAYDTFSFYSERFLAINASRLHGDNETALAAVRRMEKIVARERELSLRMRGLCAADSRLGFHSEAECHQFHVAEIDWRIERLCETSARLAEIAAALAGGRPYPESAHERDAPSVEVGGGWVDMGKGARFRVSEREDRSLAFEVDMPANVTNLLFVTMDACGTEYPRSVIVSRNERRVRPYGGYLATRWHEVREWTVADMPDGSLRFEFALDADAWGGDECRPSWIEVCSEPDTANPDFVYPFRGQPSSAFRLNLYMCDGEKAARMVWPARARGGSR